MKKVRVQAKIQPFVIEIDTIFGCKKVGEAKRILIEKIQNGDVDLSFVEEEHYDKNQLLFSFMMEEGINEDVNEETVIMDMGKMLGLNWMGCNVRNIDM